MADLVLLLEAAGVIFLIAALAMPAGLSGGLLYVPLLLLMGVTSSASASAALSQPVVVGGALAANIFNALWQRRHSEQRLIEPGLAVAAIAPCLAGVTVGALLNHVLPEVAILLLLVSTIAWNLRNSFRKALDLWRREGAGRAATAVSAPSVGSDAAVDPPLTPAEGVVAGGADGEEEEEEEWPPYSTFSVYSADSEDSTGLRHRRPAAAFDEESSSTAAGSSMAAPRSDAATAGALREAADAGSVSAAAGDGGSGVGEWLKLLGLWLFVLFAVALRGGGRGGLSPFAACSWEYWTITAGSAAALLVAGWGVRHPDISVLRCFGAGVLCAIVGIGGGLVLNPMLLNLGVDAMRATATVSVLMLVICTSATLTFAVAGSIPLLPMAVLSAAAFAGSLSGKSIVSWAVARTGRTSILVFLLAAFMATSGSVILTQGVAEIARSIASGELSFFEIHGGCPSD